MDLYFECENGISGDMAVAALLDLGADREKLKTALDSINLEDEFSYKISKKAINSIMAEDFDVICHKEQQQKGCHGDFEHSHGKFEHSHNALEYSHNGFKHNHYASEHNHSCKEHFHNISEYNHNCDEHHHDHHHRNLEDVNLIIEKANATKTAKDLAKKIFQIVAEAEAKVHGRDIKDVHFHEVGAIDSIVDILSFAVLYDDLNPDSVYFSTLSEGYGEVICQHGALSVPVPAVLEIVSKYQIPIKITKNEGEMITPTGAAIVASLYNKKELTKKIIIEKVGCGAGKRPYKNPVLRVMKLK